MQPVRSFLPRLVPSPPRLKITKADRRAREQYRRFDLVWNRDLHSNHLLLPLVHPAPPKAMLPLSLPLHPRSEVEREKHHESELGAEGRDSSLEGELEYQGVEGWKSDFG